MMSVDPGKKVQEEHDEEQEYDRVKYDHVFSRNGCRINVSETDCRGSHETKIDEIEPGMCSSLQQAEPSVNDRKIEGNFDVVEEQKQDRPLGRTGFVEDLGGKEKRRDIENRFRQQIAGNCINQDIRIPSQQQGQERKQEFQQDIKFNRQLSVRRASPAKSIADVYARIKELLYDQKEPEDLLQSYVIVRFIVPNLVQIQFLAPDD